MDFWLFLDAIAPAALIGQALARPANFINQELYGPPTNLPWGISIDAAHRLQQYSNLGQYPVEVTRFHPTFAYEMILNILAALLLLWISRQYAEKMKPGAMFAGWLIAAGLIRTFIEFFRPDQPRIGNSFVSYSMLVSFLMAVAGVVMLLIRYGKLHLTPAEGWEEEYQIKPIKKEGRPRREKVVTQDVIALENVEEETIPALEKKKRAVKPKTPVKKKPAAKAKTPAKRTASKNKSKE